MDTDTLANLATPDLLDRAAAVARDSGADSDERWAAVTALWKRPERSVFERAAQWCTSTNADERALGASVLAQLGAPAVPTAEAYTLAFPFAEASTPLLVDLLRDADDDVVVEALYALGHLRVGPTSEIAAFARHASNRMREATAHALGGRDEPTAIDALRLLSADADRDVRNWATFGLGTQCESDSPAIRESLVARLADDDGEIRGEALVGLARRRDERAIAAIGAELARREVTLLAIEAAALMPSREFVTRLRALWNSEPDHETLRALEACEAATDSSAT